HLPAVQNGVFCGHTMLQAPQFFGSERTSSSHPLARLPSQLSYPMLHESVHAPAMHAATAFWPIPMQTLPHAPQLLRSVASFTSQPLLAFPSQSSKPCTQPADAHAPFWHAGTVLFFGAHFTPHPPQLARSPLVSMHWPAQHAPLLQAALQPPQCA